MATAARGVAFDVVRRTFEDGAYTDLAFAAAARRAGLVDRERAQAQRLAYGAVQRRGTADALIAELTGRPIARVQAPLLAALRIGIFEVLYAEGTPAHAAVSEAVELAKRSGSRRGAGFVNAVLRRVVDEGEEILSRFDAATPAGAAVALSYPAWLCELWWAELGPASARSLLAAMNEPAETALRVNTLRANAEALAGELAGEGVRRPPAGLLGPPEALVVSGRIGAGTADRIEAGDLVPQSRASQAVVSVLDPLPGERVLDLCAGPGIKTTAIAARLRDEGSVTAVEIDAGRARRIDELAERVGARCVTVVNADARSIDPDAEYDRVLVDPPCTDLGTLAARPDARWRKSREAVARLARLGGQLLGAGAAAVRPGGRVVYSTCTISRAENESVVAGYLDKRSPLAPVALGAEHPELGAGDGRFLQTRPDRDRTSGFFIARLEAARP